MPVVFDAGYLGLLLHPSARIPDDPKTGLPVERAKDRVDQFVRDLDEENIRIVIPTPVLWEFLILAKEDGPTYVSLIGRSSRFQVVPFDQMAAIEAAAALLASIGRGDKRSGMAETPWQKIKIDRQIVAIAKTRHANVIYSNDKDVATLGRESGLEVRHVSTLRLPPEVNPLFEGL